MNNLSNPFTPFVAALESSHEGHASIQGAGGQGMGSIDTHGSVQHLHDEIGRNSGMVDHMSHSSATLHSASGGTVGHAHTLGNTTEITDKSGAHAATIHHGVGHDTIEYAHNHETQTVDHLGHTDIYHGAHGIEHTVHHG